MRILHVISTLAPSSGGPTFVVRDLAATQIDRGHQVTICTTDRGNPVRERLPDSYFRTVAAAGVQIKEFPVVFAPLLLSPAAGRWLAGSLNGFDIVHIHGLYRFLPTYAAWQARRQSVPYVIMPHGALDPYLYAKSSAAGCASNGSTSAGSTCPICTRRAPSTTPLKKSANAQRF